MEETLVLIKPDAVKAAHIGEIITIYEKNKLEIVKMRMLTMTKEIAAKHYEEHIGRPYYEELEKFMTSGKIVAMILKGEDAIKRVREINGKTDPNEAADGTIRKLYAESKQHNAVHASDSPENAKREIAIFFG
ncbi:MAG: nucleoside-diphosphate kinase [Selenomonadaceae bacterium]|nr:nucleoside-diphosphate kinase [Selenomonadaceae bacterium]MBP3722760.1 nucleoside-diphosphate kinase [Selenomonadaceae bacterium]